MEEMTNLEYLALLNSRCSKCKGQENFAKCYSCEIDIIRQNLFVKDEK